MHLSIVKRLTTFVNFILIIGIDILNPYVYTLVWSADDIHQHVHKGRHTFCL